MSKNKPFKKMRGLTDRQLIGGMQMMEMRLADMATKHNAMLDMIKQMHEDAVKQTGAVNGMSNGLAWALHKLGHPAFLDVKYAEFGASEQGIVLTDGPSIVTP